MKRFTLLSIVISAVVSFGTAIAHTPHQNLIHSASDWKPITSNPTYGDCLELCDQGPGGINTECGWCKTNHTCTNQPLCKNGNADTQDCRDCLNYFYKYCVNTYSNIKSCGD